MIERLEQLPDGRLEQMLLDATHGVGVSGRAAMARVTAIRTILRRRAERRAGDDVGEDALRALELVNATRGPCEQLDSVHSSWTASILADSGWAALYASDDDMARAGAKRLSALEGESNDEGSNDE